MKTLNDFNMKTKKPWEVEGVERREVKLGNLVIEKPKYGLTAKAKDKGKTVFLRITDIDDKGDIKNNGFKFVDLDETEKAKYDVKKGDLLLARSGSVGNFFIAFKDYPDWIYASYLIRFRLDLNKIHLMFVKYFLSSQFFKRWVSFQKRPGAQPNINAKEFSSFKIPLPFRNGKPDLETQKKIVEYIEANFSRIDKILEKKKKELEQLDEFWESVLEQAFKPKEGEEWREVGFNKLISREKYQVGKVKVRNGLTNSGKILVVDQSQDLIRGYLDDEKLKYRGPLPLIIFGDHTKVIKFIDFPFIVGADGVKILIPNKDLLYPKYFYWLLREVKLPDRGYARHFKFLKQATYLIPFRNGKPDLEKQKEIANYLDSVYEKIKALKEKIQNQITQIEEMKESILDEMFNHDRE